jgi:TctA family transporter
VTADWFAYAHAVQSAKDKSRFGKGDVRGVIAPEASNNSCKGGHSELQITRSAGFPSRSVAPHKCARSSKT